MLCKCKKLERAKCLLRIPIFSPDSSRKRGEVKHPRRLNRDCCLHMTTFMESLVYSIWPAKWQAAK